MRLFVLGAGVPTPTPDRWGSSYVLELGDQYLMFDCGPATTHKLVKTGLRPTQVDYLFFTHHHSDHDLDYPCFLLTRWEQSIGGEPDLEIYGPTLTELITHRLVDEKEGAFAHDFVARVNHPLSLGAYQRRGGKLPRKMPVYKAKDVGPGSICSGSDWEITAAPAEHVQPYLDSLAYRLDGPEGSIVVTGDTRPCQSVLDLAKDVDVMVCLCVDVQSKIDGTPEAEYMCGSTAVGEMARDAGAKKLVLVHESQDMGIPGAPERALGDIAKVYDGPVIRSKELQVIDL